MSEVVAALACLRSIISKAGGNEADTEIEAHLTPDLLSQDDWAAGDLAQTDIRWVGTSFEDVM